MKQKNKTLEEKYPFWEVVKFIMPFVGLYFIITDFYNSLIPLAVIFSGLILWEIIKWIWKNS